MTEQKKTDREKEATTGARTDARRPKVLEVTLEGYDERQELRLTKLEKGDRCESCEKETPDSRYYILDGDIHNPGLCISCVYAQDENVVVKEFVEEQATAKQIIEAFSNYAKSKGYVDYYPAGGQAYQKARKVGNAYPTISLLSDPKGISAGLYTVRENDRKNVVTIYQVNLDGSRRCPDCGGKLNGYTRPIFYRCSGRCLSAFDKDYKKIGGPERDTDLRNYFKNIDEKFAKARSELAEAQLFAENLARQARKGKSEELIAIAAFASSEAYKAEKKIRNAVDKIAAKKRDLNI